MMKGTGQSRDEDLREAWGSVGALERNMQRAMEEGDRREHMLLEDQLEDLRGRLDGLLRTRS